MSSMMCGMLLGAGVSAKKTYIDDVFSTYVYKGSGSARSINNGIDLSGKGGLVWTKIRDTAYSHMLNDTVRTNGRTHRISSDADLAETNYGATGITAWNSNGYSLGTDAIGMINDSSKDYASWSFRKSPGFFDVVTYTGNGSDRTIAHSLGSVPGMILVKQTSSANEWAVYHKSLDTEQYLMLDQTSAALTSGGDYWNDTTATATHFSVGAVPSAGNGAHRVNTNGETYVAYLFGGGESTAATARSVDFDGTNDWLSLASTSDFAFGTGDFTWEYWFKAEDDGSYHLHFPDSGASIDYYTYQSTTRRLRYTNNTTSAKEITDVILSKGIWYHFAAARSSGTTKVFLNGIEKLSFSDTHNYGNSSLYIGATNVGGSQFTGKISNLRIVKGTAVYTSSFRVPTEPLTNITNTTLLCCNNSSVTGKTVGGTITATGSPTALSDSPFDDPAGFVFGENEDQEIIKCGSYAGNGVNGTYDYPEITVGFEPQWLLVKCSDGAESWLIFDAIRGIVSGGSDSILRPNLNNSELVTDFIELTPTGFKPKQWEGRINEDGKTYIYVAIRRPDGYVGKPPELGTGVFAMDTGAASSTIPNFDSGFPVDFSLDKKPASSGNWSAAARLMSDKYLQANTNAAEVSYNKYTFDSNVGWNEDSGLGSIYQSWMWKRHAGFDVVCYTGSSTPVPRQIPHSLNKIPEMIWIKRRDSATDWAVYHKGLNGGTNPEQYWMKLNENDAEADHDGVWYDTAPTSRFFTVGGSGNVNTNNSPYIALLFASVDGISKVGYYDGSSTSSAQTITTGFQPRFLMVKRINASGTSSAWINVDTTRGWVNGNDKVNYFNLNAAYEEYGMSYPISTGFVLDVDASFNMANNKYIYYAHA